jgi:hypothetical protein
VPPVVALPLAALPVAVLCSSFFFSLGSADAPPAAAEELAAPPDVVPPVVALPPAAPPVAVLCSSFFFSLGSADAPPAAAEELAAPPGCVWGEGAAPALGEALGAPVAPPVPPTAAEPEMEVPAVPPAGPEGEEDWALLEAPLPGVGAPARRSSSPQAARPSAMATASAGVESFMCPPWLGCMKRSKLRTGFEASRRLRVRSIAFRGKDLRPLPLLKRKAALQQELRRTDDIVYCQHVGESGEKLYQAAEELEGVIGKKADRPYLRGRTTN